MSISRNISWIILNLQISLTWNNILWIFSERANILSLVIKRLSEIGVKVRILTCDGHPVQIRMYKKLGAILTPKKKNISTQLNSFDSVIYMSLDSPHMVKCIRNTFGKYKRLKNGDNLVIDWKYIELLNELQSTQKLSAANKLTSLHVKYHSQKMKVHLAVQLFSNSVANALDYWCLGLL